MLVRNHHTNVLVTLQTLSLQRRPEVRVDVGTKMRYKSLASPSRRPRQHVGDAPRLLDP